MSQKDTENLRLQYQQCYESLRAHDAAIWQIPSIAGAISAGLILGAHTYAKGLVVLEAILVLAWFLNFILLIAVVKHRFFSGIEQKTLCQIEDQLEVKRIQRVTHPDCKANYWYRKEEYILVQGWSAHITLMFGMIVILGIISVLIVGAPFYSGF